jgi:hypothetical protein
MALGRQARNQRASPRVDALLRVKGELVAIGFPLRILNVNRTGFAVLSEVRFRSGERLEFRLTDIRGPSIHVTAAAVHTQSLRDSTGLYVTGFVFQAGRRSAGVDETAILRLISSIAPAGFKA